VENSQMKNGTSIL